MVSALRDRFGSTHIHHLMIMVSSVRALQGAGALGWPTARVESGVAKGWADSLNGITLHQLPRIPGRGDFLPNFLPRNAK
jgi:hypothetical protein